MALQDFIDALPEDKRDAFKAELDGVAVIKEQGDVERLFKEHKLVKSVYDRDISKTYERMEETYKKEKLPSLLEAERKKGEKSPLELEIEQIKRERENDKRELALERQRARVLAKASEYGVLVNSFLGDGHGYAVVGFAFSGIGEDSGVYAFSISPTFVVLSAVVCNLVNILLQFGSIHAETI